MRRLASLLLISLALSACGDQSVTPHPSTAPAIVPAATGSAAGGSAVPRYGPTPCPDDIAIVALATQTCGLLTVLEDRSKPAGHTVSLLVIEYPKPQQDARSWYGAEFGDDIGVSHVAPNIAGSVRTKAGGYMVEVRGLRYSDPNLDCPEIDGLAVTGAEAASDDGGFRQQLVAAVAACRARLVSAGIDLAAYDVENAAADLEDLRAVLGLDQWGMLDTKGDTSLYTFAFLRQWPTHVGTVVIDSPRFPADHDPQAGLESALYAWGQFTDACGADPTCHRLLPDPGAALRAAVAKLDADPVIVNDTTGSLTAVVGRPVQVRVDGTKLLRVVRSVLGGDGPGNLAYLPSMLAAGAQGEVHPRVVSILASNPTLCVGYRPECRTAASFAWGAYLSVYCRDILPFAEPVSTSTAEDDPGFARLFDDDVMQAACDAWQVPPAASSVGETRTVATPMLVYTGQLDAWSSRPRVETAMPLLTGAHYYELAGQTHNVMGFTDCSISMRNAWLDAPEQPPPDTSCLAGLHPEFRFDASDGG